MKQFNVMKMDSDKMTFRIKISSRNLFWEPLSSLQVLNLTFFKLENCDLYRIQITKPDFGLIGNKISLPLRERRQFIKNGPFLKQ